MRRLIIGFTLLLLVVAILVVLPTVVFGYLWGTEAVIHHWAWVIYLAALILLLLTALWMTRPLGCDPAPLGPGGKIHAKYSKGPSGAFSMQPVGRRIARSPLRKTPPH